MSSKLADAYSVLGLEEGCSIEVVKSTYRQIALRTHPDKNPNDANATAQFQRVGEAHNVILKHLERLEAGYGHDLDGYEDDYDDYDSYSDDEDLDFYMFLFEQFMRSSSHHHYSHARYRREHKGPETPEEYKQRIRNAREEQAAAQVRRQQENAARKLRQEQDREQDRLAAEERQKAKVEEKKAQAEAQRKKAEATAMKQRMKVQAMRSDVFAAARSGDASAVKKGVWEDEVDAAGGEVKPGCHQYVMSPPIDSKETLLHIAAANGDYELVEWLDVHNADVEERNAEGFTAIHTAVRHGQISAFSYFLNTYSPKDSDSTGIYTLSDSKPLLSLAVESNEPELVFLVIDNGLASTQDINMVWSRITSVEGKESMKKIRLDKAGSEKYEDIIKLLTRFGGFTPPSTPSLNTQNEWQANNATSVPAPSRKQKPKEASNQARSPLEELSQQTAPPLKKQALSHKTGRGRGRNKGQ